METLDSRTVTPAPSPDQNSKSPPGIALPPPAAGANSVGGEAPAADNKRAVVPLRKGILEVTICKQLADTDPAVRLNAVNLLGALAGDRLEESDPVVRRTAAVFLNVPLNDKDPGVRRAALLWLRQPEIATTVKGEPWLKDALDAGVNDLTA
jgi:hypothetical protein